MGSTSDHHDERGLIKTQQPPPPSFAKDRRDSAAEDKNGIMAAAAAGTTTILNNTQMVSSRAEQAGSASKYVTRSKSMNTTTTSNQARRKWALPDLQGLNDREMMMPSSSANSLSFDKDSSRAPFEGMLQSACSGQNVGGDADEMLSTMRMSARSSPWLQHIGHEFHEVLRVKTKSHMQDLPTSTDAGTADNGPSHSLLSLISVILGDKPVDEVPMLVEFMLRKVMEEFEHHLLTQRKQVTKVSMVDLRADWTFDTLLSMHDETPSYLNNRYQAIRGAQMKSTLRELLLRQEKLVSRNMVLEALAAGSQEEVKIKGRMTPCSTDELSFTGSEENFPPSYLLESLPRFTHMEMEKKQLEEEKRVKDEELDRLLKESDEKQMAVQVLKNELDYIKHLDEEQLLRLEKEKREIEVESKERVRTLELQLQDAQKKMREIEVNLAREISGLRVKDVKCQKVLCHQAQEYKNLRCAQYNAKEKVLQMQVEWKNQLSTLENELQGMARAASAYHKVLAENRALYNEVQDLKGNIRVYCRVRPFLTYELGRPTTVDYIGENGEIVLVNPSKPGGGKETRRTFTFNKVFGTTASQEEVFMDTQPLIRSVLDGYNVCIFAYGQTGSGKTFTMSGPNNTTPADWGVNYRALHDLFHMSQKRLDLFRYEISVQMLEIYNEQVRDLLNTDGIRNKSQLNGLNVPDASMMPVRSTEDVLELMKVGHKNRAVGATALNERSSRSHSVLTVHVQGTDLGSGAILRGSLHLVDLAGSERVDKSEATGDRLKEAQHINKSLSALGDVIAALAQKNGHVPYRNSKLTQLLQDSLGGQAKTLMFVHISPDMESFGETISTLKFAERVSSVELGAACSNKESGEVQNLRDQVAQLRDAAAKRDAEIERFQALKDRAPPTGESNLLANEKLKFKPMGASPLCSPLGSPTECRIALEGSEVASDMNDKLKLLKMQHASLGQNHMSMDADIVVPTFKARHKQQETSSLGNQGEIIMHDIKHLSRILDITPQMASSNLKEESILKECPERSANSGHQIFQTVVPRPPVKNAPTKVSPIRSDRRSLGGQLPQIRTRRYTNGPIVASTDKPVTKQNISLRGSSVPEASQDGVSENNGPYDAALKPSLSRNISAGKSSKRWI
ncbi:unnamed protein product [Sphagnum balticum]